MAPLVSMEDFIEKQLRPGSTLNILGQVAFVAREQLKQRRKEKSIKVKTQMGSSTSSTPKVKEPNYVAETYSKETDADMNKRKSREVDDVDHHDKGFQLKQRKTIFLHEEFGTTSKTKEPNSSMGKEFEADALYSVGTIRRDRSFLRTNYITSSDSGFQEKNGLTKKKSIDGGEDGKAWSLKPKPKNMKIKKEKGLGFKRPKEHMRAPRYSTDPNDLPEDLKRKIGTLEGIESFEKAKMTMVIEKRLFETDLTDSASRLSMPLKQIKPESFLDEDEIKFLASQQDWPVSVISPELKDENLTFRQWNMNKNNGNVSSSYVLKTGWNELHKKNGLQVNDVIQVWSFRDVGNNLHFALVLVEKATEGGLSSGGDRCM
ncbi:putative B3 domain-containing protein At5g35780 [Rosa rugosa]|uniref:putative B3 domain-containing protein At5g35780 n=1 Tax=Rosa rugosa TaxID=74645 RepID=UPI002B40C70A|nr:putative B3 domain-containing protein At5g35780 [Rosa rugosa]